MCNKYAVYSEIIIIKRATYLIFCPLWAKVQLCAGKFILKGSPVEDKSPDL